MRPLATTTVLLGLVLLSGCAAATTATTATPTATPTPTATQSAAPLTEPQLLDKQTKTMVSLYSQLVCTNLAEHPDIDLNAAVDRVLESYSTEGLSEASRIELAHRVLEQSAAKSCPDQSARIEEGLAAG